MHEITFTEPTCLSCTDFNNKNYNDRYCNGGKRTRRFQNKDPKRKIPDWCPKRNDPPFVRVYRLKDENSKYMHMLLSSRETIGKRKIQYAIPLTHHYKLECEDKQNVTAKSFYNAALEYEAVELIGFEPEYGDVVEIDNGLKPYFFYFKGHESFQPAIFTPPEREKLKKRRKNQ